MQPDPGGDGARRMVAFALASGESSSKRIPAHGGHAAIAAAAPEPRRGARGPAASTHG